VGGTVGLTPQGLYARIHKCLGASKMSKEYLTRCVIDTSKRCVYLYSNEGTEKTVSCETVEEFMNVLKFVRSVLDEDMLGYSNPI
jgi:hypothetical protein